MPLEKNDDRCDRKKFLTKVAVKCLRPLGRRSEAVDRNNLFGAKSCRVTDNKMSAPTFLMDVFLDPPYEISGSKHTRGEARQYMNRYGQAPSNHVTHPLAASAASTKNDTGLSKETVALLTSCLKCARPCTFTDIAVGRSKFFALKPDIQEQIFDAYQHQFLRPAGHDWVPGICSKLHLLLCDRCTPTVCQSRHPQAAISNCKGDVLCEAVPFDIDLWFDTEKLQKDLGEMLVPDFFQQYSTKVQPEKLAECATSQDIRMAEGMRVEKNHAVQDRLTRYLSQLSTLRWFQLGKRLGQSDEQLLQDTRDVGGMLAAMAKTPVV